MLAPDFVLLSVEDNKIDINGEVIQLYEGLKVTVYMDNIDEDRRVDNSIATGMIEKNIAIGWGAVCSGGVESITMAYDMSLRFDM